MSERALGSVAPDRAMAAAGTRRWLDASVAMNFLAIGILLAAVPRYVREELGGSVFVLGHLLMAVAWAPWVPFPAIAMLGVGFGAVFPALTALAVARAPDEQRGQVLGVFLSFNDLGNAVAGPVVGAIADAAGFRWSYGVPAIVATCGLFVALTLREPRGEAVVA